MKDCVPKDAEGTIARSPDDLHTCTHQCIIDLLGMLQCVLTCSRELLHRKEKSKRQEKTKAKTPPEMTSSWASEGNRRLTVEVCFEFLSFGFGQFCVLLIIYLSISWDLVRVGGMRACVCRIHCSGNCI